MCVSVCVSFQAYTRRRLWSDRDQIWHTHMQIHLEKVVAKIKICPVSCRGNLGGFRGSEIENVGNMPNGWTDLSTKFGTHMRIHLGMNIG